MIVNCPSCGTRYSHRAESAPSAVRAHCSGCDSTFPLTPAKRQYLLFATPGQGMVEESVSAGLTMAPTVAASRSKSAPLSLIVLLLAAAGGGAGYYLSLIQRADPLNWAAVGGGLGLLLGWAVMRWMARKD